MTIVCICLVAVCAGLILVLREQMAAHSAAQINQQIRHLEYVNSLQAEIRNLTASIVRSGGGAFVLPASEVKPTEKWFEGPRYVVPSSGPHRSGDI
jgi:hypothetical protein